MRITVDEGVEQRRPGTTGRRESDTTKAIKRTLRRQTIVTAVLFFALGFFYARIFG